jgi:uncharacterized protein (DUF2141 family)
MKKVICLLCLFFTLSVYCFSQAANNMTVTIVITNVITNGGRIYLAVCSTAENFRNETPDFSFVLEADNTILSQELSLPSGEYVITAYQDANNNQRIDYGLFGIPKELVGMSNYSGNGYPSKNFDRQKIMVNNSTGRITIGLYKF